MVQMDKEHTPDVQPHIVYLSLGSNLGDRARLLDRAVALLGERVGQVVRQSSFLETEPWGFSSSRRFLNACVACQTILSPRQVLVVTQEIEREMGRSQKSHNGEYHDRCIDIDILLYDDVRCCEPDLTIPHPKMRDRDFVMVPLREIYPDVDLLWEKSL